MYSAARASGALCAQMGRDKTVRRRADEFARLVRCSGKMRLLDAMLARLAEGGED